MSHVVAPAFGCGENREFREFRDFPIVPIIPTIPTAQQARLSLATTPSSPLRSRQGLILYQPATPATHKSVVGVE